VLSLEERRSLRDQILAAMSQTNGSPFLNDRFEPTPALIAMTNLLAGLADELEAPRSVNKHTQTSVTSELTDTFAQLRSQIDRVTKQINGLIEGRANSAQPIRFQTNGVEKSDAASQELSKALANGKPATWD
jgi:hypothetical protein